ncbi:6-phosphofructokinase [Candidatus Sumerlaeota bacterium]|nr:6-phosphofructokinase [Candidatus Sumerlaeota bacterium]
MRRIAILTGGGDCPGLNAVIRAVAKTAQNDHGLEVVGIRDSYWGLLCEDFVVLANRDVSGILNQGGTILGASRVNPFEETHRLGRLASPKEDWGYVKRILKRHRIDALVTVGGDGTQRVAHRASLAGIPIVAIPKTIDNDIRETDVTFGFDSAVSLVMQSLDILHTTAMSHHRAMVVEVMGRSVGWLALYAGVAGGGDVILIPEIPYDLELVHEKVLHRNSTGKRFSIVVVAEGARARGGEATFSGDTDASGRAIFGGVGKRLADRIEESTGIESRVTVLGHLQRGGPPTAYDRLLATRFGHHAVHLLVEREFGRMVALKGAHVKSVPLEKATRKTKPVPPDHPLIQAARSLDTCLGDK